MALALALALCGAAGCGSEKTDDAGGARKMSGPRGWVPWQTSLHGGGRDDGPSGEVNACAQGAAPGSWEHDKAREEGAEAPASGGELYCDGTGFEDEALRVTDGKHRPGEGGGSSERRSDFARAGGMAFTSQQEKAEGKESALGGRREVRGLDEESREQRWKHHARSTAVMDRSGEAVVVGDEATKITNEPEDGDYEDWSPSFEPGGDLIAWDARTGKESWRIKTPKKEWCSPGSIGGRTFVTCVDDEIGGGKVTWHRLDAKKRELRELYTYKRDDQEELEPIGVDRGALVFLPPKDGGSDFPPSKEFEDVLRVDAETGKVERRSLPDSLGKGARPHLVHGDLYFEQDEKKDGKSLTVVNASDGKQRWKARTSLKHTSEPTVSTRREEVYLVDPAGRLVAFDRRGGEQRWETDKARAEDGGTNPEEMGTTSSVTLVRDVLVVSTGNTVFTVSPEDPDAKPRKKHRVDLDDA